MPFYTGTTADGSDMKEFEGFYVSPNGKYFGSTPISLKEEMGLEFFTNKLLTRRERRKLKQIKEK